MVQRLPAVAIALAVAAMVGRAMAQLPPPPVEPPLAEQPVGQPAQQQALPPRAAPLRPDPAVLPSRPPTRFDASLDSLVRDGVVSPAERARIRSGSGMTPFNVPAHQQACRSGALSQQECSSGVVVRWRGRLNGGSGQIAGEVPGGFASPLPPLTVPVSALLAGAGGTFRLADVFGVTPRPAPIPKTPKPQNLKIRIKF